MSGQRQIWKKWVRWGLFAVVLADVLLLIAAWNISRQQNRTDALERLRLQHKLLAADIGRARDIRNKLPEVRQQSQQFYAQHLRPAAGGYSAIAANLADISEQSGLRISAVSYKQVVVQQHGVVQVDVSATVEGDYANLVRFVNGLERSSNFFLLRDLSLASSTSGLKLNLELRTYFKA